MVRNEVRSAESGRPGLAAGSLKIRDAVAISVSILAPGMAMLLNVPGVAAVAGGSTPLAFLLGGCGCLALAFVVVGFTRRMAGAGYAYTYLSRGLGRGSGFLAGWLYAFGVLCFVPMTMSAVAYLICDLLGLGTALWSPVFVVGMVVALAVVRVAVTSRVQLVLGVVTVLLILVVDVVVTARGGAHGNTWGLDQGRCVSTEAISANGAPGIEDVERAAERARAGGDPARWPDKLPVRDRLAVLFDPTRSSRTACSPGPHPISICRRTGWSPGSVGCMAARSR
jgi:hypothetical protein